ALGVGDPADPEAIERSRRAILNLGLFRKVRITPEQRPDGVVLHVLLDEKRYFLPVPRLDASADRDYSFGAQLHWSTVWGLNRRVSARIEEGRSKDACDRDRDRIWRARYTAP